MNHLLRIITGFFAMFSVCHGWPYAVSVILIGVCAVTYGVTGYIEGREG